MPERRRTDTDTPLEVLHGLISQENHDALRAALAANDLQAFAKLAVPLCEDNIFLFSVLFLKHGPAPHFWKHFKRIQSSPRLLIRVSRGHAKTTLFTYTAIVHRICYSVVPYSKHEDPRILALFETRDRANDRMLSVRQLFETGGPGGLIGMVFRGAQTFQSGEQTPWAGMGIPEMASKFGEWNNRTINLPHPRRLPKPDPNIRSISPGEGAVGFHPRLVIADDVVGPKTADSDLRRRTLGNWFGKAIEPMFKPYTQFWAPHTIFHPDDLNMELQRSGSYDLLTMPALNRFPDRDDFKEVRDANGTLTGIELTPKGETLIPLWGCPTHSEAECPVTEDHMNEVGYHRPVKDLIMQWIRKPMFFALQMMHVIRNTDQTSVPEWMLRFYCSNPDCPDLWKPASWHADWEDWRTDHPDAGLNKEVPRIVLFTKDGVQDEKDGPVVPIERAVHGWDLAFGRLRTNDRTVCARMYRAGKRYFVAFEKGRWKHDQVWRKVVLHAVTDPIHKPDEVALEVDAEQIYPQEVRKLMLEMNVGDRFKLTEITRTKDKDTVFQNSGLPITMSNGFLFVDHHDDDAVMELLSVTADQSGGHDDCLDALVNAYGKLRSTGGMKPGFFGAPLAVR